MRNTVLHYHPTGSSHEKKCLSSIESADNPVAQGEEVKEILDKLKERTSYSAFVTWGELTIDSLARSAGYGAKFGEQETLCTVLCIGQAGIGVDSRISDLQDKAGHSSEGDTDYMP
ncbi:hypothetical protein NQZ79_g5394 [Umbelopsis isabellina]|nr:hypothetical protein NQZ79_g5394 [Umbelopsis isabellina]